MNVVIAGGSGFLGRALTAHLRRRGDTVRILTRRPSKPDDVVWSPTDQKGTWVDVVATAGAVINLAGEPVAGGLWTLARRQKILASRIETTSAAVALIARLKQLVRAPAPALVESLPPHQTILLIGATGFIGSRLVESLLAAGHRVLVQARDPQKAVQLGTPITIVTSLDQIPEDMKIDAVINLAGESVAGGLWTQARRQKILTSRIETTAAAVALIARLRTKPALLLNASAIGWYGLYGDEILTEESDGHDCFCREVCVTSEREAQKAAAHGVRVVCLRIGLVLGSEGGILSQLLLPFEMGVGGPIGSGRQWMSWIERDDLVRLIAHVVATPSLSGPVNATAPEPERNAAFGRALGRALHRPAILPLPAAPLRLLGGDFAQEVLLGGQRVLPQKAVNSGFVFRHARLDDALRAIVG
jgi:uncharacterized protein (TIGR01777 family)